MTTVKDLLQSTSALEQDVAFIFDHGKLEEGGELKYADAMTTYGWNKFRYNKVTVGAPVLNRRPGKITKSRKFEIFGGGIIDSIGEPDAEGNVIATISHPFEFVTPITQGEAAIENMVWTSKKKKPGTWEHFWNQYGMNRISIDDFNTLTAGRNCISVENGHASLPEIEDASDIDGSTDVKDFDITIEDGVIHSGGNKTRRLTKKKGRHIDFSAVQKARDKVGALGEEIVLNMLRDEAKKNNLKEPEHVSKTEGDGLGYDIRAWDEQGKELHIEVKATKTHFADGFIISRNELNASREQAGRYKVYRVFNLDVNTGKCSLRIYDGPFMDEDYRFEPTAYTVYMK